MVNRQMVKQAPNARVVVIFACIFFMYFSGSFVKRHASWFYNCRRERIWFWDFYIQGKRLFVLYWSLLFCRLLSFVAIDESWYTAV